MFSEAADRNKQPILETIAPLLNEAKNALEIGSGTGQHVHFFAQQYPQLNWIASDCGEYLPVLRNNLARQPLPNIQGTVEIDVRQPDWYIDPVELIYSANCLHIMSWVSVEHFFRGVGQYLSQKGYLVVYGPFKYKNEFTTPSNADFELWLKARDPESGIRDFEKVDALAKAVGLKLRADHVMPANNQCLVWQRS